MIEILLLLLIDLFLRNFLSRNGYMYEDNWRYKRPINHIDLRI